MVTVLSGSNIFALRHELGKLSAEFVTNHGALALERIDAEDASAQTILDAIQNLPLLAERKLVVVRSLSANKQAAEAIEQIISATGGTTDLIIYEPALDKRTTYFKKLKTLTNLKQFNELDENELCRWLIDETKSRGGSLKFVDALHLVRQVGTNQLMLNNELDKLLTYEPNITRENIDFLVEPLPQSRIFDLLDVAFAGNGHRALALYDEQRAQKVEPQAILAMIAWQLHNLALVHSAGGRKPAAIAEEAHINPFVISKTIKLAGRVSKQTLIKIIDEALDIDYRSKTSGIDLDQALKNYLVGLAV